MKDNEFDKNFWGFIFLLTTYPNIYLNNNGKIMFNLVVKNGKCNSFKCLSKDIKITQGTVSNIIKKMPCNHLEVTRKGRKKQIVINEKILSEGLKIAEMISR